jgi:TPR repeat protein
MAQESKRAFVGAIAAVLIAVIAILTAAIIRSHHPDFSPAVSNREGSTPALNDSLAAPKRYFQAKQDAQAVPLFREASEAGNAEAALYLGIIYEDGHGGLPKDYAQAVAWYNKAADAGNAKAMSNLGIMYAEGKGLRKADAQAVDLFRRAGQLGDDNGLYNLGLMYEYGLGGVPKDSSQALELIRKAAKAGNRPAQGALQRLAQH